MLVTDQAAQIKRFAGSFRDPSGYVFEHQGCIYRAIDNECYDLLRKLDQCGLFQRLTESRLLVGTNFVEDPELIATLSGEQSGQQHFLTHDLISPITYPYEWTYSMLADAALHTLSLQTQLLKEGFSLKDATAYNIQFINSRPTFIDISSIECPARLDLWYALGQFQQMFTFPLLLCRYHGWDLRSYFLGHLNGRTSEQVSQTFSWLGKWRPRLLLDLTLPLMLNRREEKKAGTKRSVLEKPNKNSKPQVMNLQRLRSKLRKLAAGYKTRGVWASYTATCSYDDQAEEAKKALVRQYLESARPARVLDIGCNTGDYSYIAAEYGAKVIAVDSDHDAVDILYERLRDQPAKITPMVVDVTNPSPAIGYLNQERSSFLERMDVDCVLALALLHHLQVSGNLSIAACRDMFYDLTNQHLLMEFVPTNDPMFERLMKFRVDLYQGLTLDSCRQVFTERFAVIDEKPIPGTLRTLLFLRKLH